jgi:hypothetical protein
MSKPGAVAFAMLLVVAGAGPAQQRLRDPQSTFEPRSEPGIGQKLLEKMAGDWDVAKTLYIRSREPLRIKGECHQRMIHDGRFLKSEFVFEDSQGKTTGLGIIGFDVQTGKFTSAWTDSRSTRMSLRQSEGMVNGQEIVLFGRNLGDSANGPSRSRTVSKLEDDGRKLVHRLYVLGPDDKERLVMELLMTRRGQESGHR